MQSRAGPGGLASRERQLVRWKAGKQALAGLTLGTLPGSASGHQEDDKVMLGGDKIKAGGLWTDPRSCRSHMMFLQMWYFLGQTGSVDEALVTGSIDGRQDLHPYSLLRRETSGVTFRREILAPGSSHLLGHGALHHAHGNLFHEGPLDELLESGSGMARCPETPVVGL